MPSRVNAILAILAALAPLGGETSLSRYSHSEDLLHSGKDETWTTGCVKVQCNIWALTRGKTARPKCDVGRFEGVTTCKRKIDHRWRLLLLESLRCPLGLGFPIISRKLEMFHENLINSRLDLNRELLEKLKSGFFFFFWSHFPPLQIISAKSWQPPPVLSDVMFTLPP